MGVAENKGDEAKQGGITQTGLNAYVASFGRAIVCMMPPVNAVHGNVFIQKHLRVRSMSD